MSHPSQTIQGNNGTELRVKGCAPEEQDSLPARVRINADSGGLSYYFAMTPDRAREMAQVLLYEANLAEGILNGKTQYDLTQSAITLARNAATLMRKAIPFVGYDGVDCENIKEEMRKMCDDLLGPQT